MKKFLNELKKWSGFIIVCIIIVLIILAVRWVYLYWWHPIRNFVPPQDIFYMNLT